MEFFSTVETFEPHGLKYKKSLEVGGGERSKHVEYKIHEAVLKSSKHVREQDSPHKGQTKTCYEVETIS